MCVKPEDANSDFEGNVSRNVLRPFHLRLRDSAAGLHLKFQNPLVEKGIPRPEFTQAILLSLHVRKKIALQSAGLGNQKVVFFV